MKKDEVVNEYLEMYSNFQRIEDVLKDSDDFYIDDETKTNYKILKNYMFGSSLKKQNNKETKDKIKRYICLLEEELGLSVSYDFEDYEEESKMKRLR